MSGWEQFGVARGANLRGEVAVATIAAATEELAVGGWSSELLRRGHEGLAGDGGVCVSIVVGAVAVQVDGGA